MFKNISVLFLLTWFITSLAQEGIKTGHFSRTPFNKGLPEPMSKFPWTEAFFAEVESGSFYKQIYVVFKDQNSYPASGTMVVVKLGGGFTIATINLDGNSQNDTEFALD